MSATEFDPFRDGVAATVEAADGQPGGFDPFRDGAAMPVAEFDPFAGGKAVHVDDTDGPDVAAEAPAEAPGIIRESGRALARGAGQGFYRGVEGAARLVAKLPTSLEMLAQKLESVAYEGRPEERAEAQRRLASVVGVRIPDGLTPEEQNRFMRERMLRYAGAVEKDLKPQQAAKWYADAAKQTTDEIGQALPVSQRFANSLGGQIVEGIGQAIGTLPTYAVPGVGPAHTIGQMYTAGRDDAVANGATPEQAHQAGILNVPAAAVDVVADKLLIGKILKPLRGKMTLGRLASEVATAAAANGVSEGVQQAWLNTIAANLSGYDPDRELDDDVIRSVVVGAAVGGGVAGGGSLVTNTTASDVEGSPDAPTAPGTPRRDENGATQPAMSPAEDTTAPEAPEAARAREAAEAADAAAFVDKFGQLVDPEGTALARREDAADPAAQPGDGMASIPHDGDPGRVMPSAEEVEAANAQESDGLQAERAPAAELVEDGAESFDGPPPEMAETIRTAQTEAEAGGLRLSRWQRLAWGRLAYEGAADVMERTAHPLGKKLAAAMRRHTDLADELVGRLSEPFEAALEPANSLRQRVFAGSPTRDAPAVRQAKREFEAYYRARENQQRWIKTADGEWQQLPVPENVEDLRAVRENASPLGQRLIHAWERTAALTGQLSQRAGVQVFDAGEKHWRPIGNLGEAFFPRRVRSDVRRAISDPKRHPELIAQLMQDLVEQGRTEAEAKAILTPGSEDLASSNDFMGNLEKGREGMLPESFYEYRFDPVVKGFIGNYAERLAQIASYGQKTTPDTADLFDFAERRASDSFTRRYIAQAREQAYGRHRDGALERFMSRAGTFATGAMLSNPVSSLRNLVSGLYGTAELVGVERALDALGKVSEPTLDMDAKQLGVLRGNLFDAQFFDDFDTANDKTDRVLRKVVEVGLKGGGYTGAETFVRRHATAAAMQFVTDGVEDVRNNPKSRHAREFLAAAKRLGLDGEKIAAEGLDFRNGMETRAFIRRQVKASQGGYRFDQVPLWANSPAGRFLYQFGRWGTQRTRALYREMWVPAVFGTEIEVHGRRQRVRNVRPLLLAGTGTVLVGSLFAAVADALFDRERPDASFTEIAERMDEDTSAGLSLLGDRLCNDIVTGGMIGIAGQPIAAGRELTVFNRVRNPLNPPGVQAFGNLMDVVYSALDEGGLPSGRVLLRAAEAQFSGFKNAKEATLNLAAKAGADWDAARRYQAKQDQRLLRNLTWRFAREEGVEATRGGIGAAGLVRRTRNAAVYDEIQDALSAGDAPQARQLAEEYLWRAKTEREFRDRLASLRSAVRSRQPFRVGTHNGEALRVAFYDWARARLPDSQLERIMRVDRTYYETALRSGLMMARPPEEETVRKAEVKRLRERRLQGKALEEAIERAIGPRLKER